MLADLDTDMVCSVTTGLVAADLASLACCSRWLSATVASSHLWAQSAAHLGIHPELHLSQARKLVLTISHADQMLAHSEVIPGSRLHCVCSQGSDAGIMYLLHQLSQNKLCAFASSTGDVPTESRGAPIVLVCCDATATGWEPSNGNCIHYLHQTSTAKGLTMPCAQSRCFNPAMAHHKHCKKHCGSGATYCVKRCIGELYQPPNPCRIVFAAPSIACRDVYRRLARGTLLGRVARSVVPGTACVDGGE